MKKLAILCLAVGLVLACLAVQQQNKIQSFRSAPPVFSQSSASGALVGSLVASIMAEKVEKNLRNQLRAYQLGAGVCMAAGLIILSRAFLEERKPRGRRV
jgi:hydroxyethylthiazole kinase-like sugar kinase family protein